MKKTVLVLLAAASLFMTACNSENKEEASSNDTSEIIRPDIGADIVSGEDGSGALPNYTDVSDAMRVEALAKVSESFDKDSTDEIAEGVTVRTLEFGEGKAYIITADLTKCTLKAATPYDLVPDTTNQSLRGQAEVMERKGYNVLAGIGANLTNKATHIPSGIIIKNSETIYNNSVGDDGSMYFGLYSDGGAFACNYEDYCKIYRNKVSEAVSATHLLVLNGKPQDVPGTVYEEASIRTGAGFSADRRTVCLVYADGVDVTQLANLLIASGCSVAVNFGYGEELSMLGGDTVYGAEAPIGPTLMITEMK